MVPTHVPRLLPEVLANNAPAELRKRVFLRNVLPAVLRANAEIRAQRHFLHRVAVRRAAGARLDPARRARLTDLAEQYKVDSSNMAALRRRVDIVPPSLALAQAAIESGWGASRFAQQANALFGQRIYDCASCGLKPRGFEEDPDFRVRGFDSVLGSVRAYMRNLNTHPAYRDLRERRLAARRRGKPLNGPDLVAGLMRYSERGAAYIRDVQRTIAANDLTDFDRARLAWQPCPAAVRP